MNAYKLITEGYKRIFSGSDSVKKNTLIFIFQSIVSGITIYFEKFENLKDFMSENPFMLLAVTIAFLILTVYISGYSYKFVNRSFTDSENILPVFNMEPFTAFLKALPLLVVWFIYLLAIIFAAVSFVKNPITLILSIILIIAFVIIAVFLPFVYIDFCQNFELKKELFNILLPFKFVKQTAGLIILLGLLFIPVIILCIIPGLLAVIICAVTGIAKSHAIYINLALWSYLTYMTQLLWYYCLVQIYKEKFLNNQKITQ